MSQPERTKTGPTVHRPLARAGTPATAHSGRGARLKTPQTVRLHFRDLPHNADEQEWMQAAAVASWGEQGLRKQTRRKFVGPWKRSQGRRWAHTCHLSESDTVPEKALTTYKPDLNKPDLRESEQGRSRKRGERENPKQALSCQPRA